MKLNFTLPSFPLCIYSQKYTEFISSSFKYAQKF